MTVWIRRTHNCKLLASRFCRSQGRFVQTLFEGLERSRKGEGGRLAASGRGSTFDGVGRTNRASEESWILTPINPVALVSEKESPGQKSLR